MYSYVRITNNNQFLNITTITRLKYRNVKVYSYMKNSHSYICTFCCNAVDAISLLILNYKRIFINLNAVACFSLHMRGTYLSTINDEQNFLFTKYWLCSN